MATSSALIVLHLVKGLDIEEAALSVLVLALLLVTRPAFTGAPNPRSARHTAAVFAVSFVAVTVTGSGLVLVDPDDVIGSRSLGRVLAQVWLGLIGIGGPLRFTSQIVGGRIAATLVLLGIAVAALTLTAALRPAGGPHPIRAQEADRVRELLRAPGCTDSWDTSRCGTTSR